jgi:hypothetical protein
VHAKEHRKDWTRTALWLVPSKISFFRRTFYGCGKGPHGPGDNGFGLRGNALVNLTRICHDQSFMVKPDIICHIR